MSKFDPSVISTQIDNLLDERNRIDQAMWHYRQRSAIWMGWSKEN